MPSIPENEAAGSDPKDRADPLAEHIALLQRRLSRSERARAEAETLLEQKSRVLAQANEELQARKDDLLASLELTSRQLLDAQRVAGFGTLIWDVAERKLEVSDQIKLLFDISATKKVDSHRTLLKQVHPEDRASAAAWLYRNLHGRAVRGNVELSDDRLCLFRINVGVSEPEFRWLLGMAEIQVDHLGFPQFIFGTVQDVTVQTRAAAEAAELREREVQRLADLEQLNQQLILARETADQANSAKSRFLAMMSHDIRTPLNGVIGMLGLLDDATLSSDQQQTLNLARASGQQLRVLLDDIIDLARSEAGKLQLNPIHTDLAKLLGDSAAFWRYAAAHKQLTLDAVLDPGLPKWVSVDPVRLRQLIDNLLSNAIKYTVRGGISLRADLVAGDRLRVEVIDTGIGIPPSRRMELFQDFGQLQMQGSEPGGAGLGLAICRRIIEVMDGTIGVESTTPGSCFWFEVPCRKVSAPYAAAESAVRPLTRKDGGPLRVLVAEDIATNRIVVEGHLSKLSCEVTLVENGKEAVDAVAAGDFDLVLLDMAMPVMDGAEAAREIRAMAGAKRKTPIVALTAYARPEELAPIMEAGANASASKPIVGEDLYKVIKSVIDQHRQENRSRQARVQLPPFIG